MTRKYRFGFDIGIGSTGWAVLSYTNNDDVRIEDVGVHLFSSGEDPQTSKNLNQTRRGYRGVKRLIRRRHYRKIRAKNYLVKIGLLSAQELQLATEKNGNQNIYAIRLKGLTEKLSKLDILNCVIHICNHRGYNEFYEEDSSDTEDAGKIQEGLANFEQIYSSKGYKSVAEMILKDDVFKAHMPFPDYRNRKNNGRYILLKRKYLKEELTNILRHQQQYYQKQLTNANIEFLVNEIVFAQRDFEEGPGDPDDAKRKFKGFLDSMGQCMYYKDQQRGFRSTVISDLYSLVNSLSQFSYVNKETGEIYLPPKAAKEILQTALLNGCITEADVKKILNKFEIEIIKSSKLNETIPDTVKTIKILKNMLSDAGYSWAELINEDQLDLDKPSKLHKLCVLLSSNITPHRRNKAMKVSGWNDKLQEAAKRKKFGGSASVSYKYMIEAIHAFENGETYGNFQARRMNELESRAEKHLSKVLPPFTLTEDEDLVKNTVVFKAVNETRKVINALVRKYGSPDYINIEVANDLGRSLIERREIEKRQNDNRKTKEKIIKKIAELRLGGINSEADVKGAMIERYKLYQLQNEHCLYCGSPIKLERLLTKDYEVDHIIPQSLILDDSLENKALVCAACNQKKRQQTPLQFLTEEQGKEFLKTVSELFRKKKISSRKYKYLIQPNLYDGALLDEWKSRNLNDTRYLSKYISNYLQNNLEFANTKGKNVYSIKGSITSRMRRVWLNKKTWGAEVKDRETSALHHAADAVVIANLTPAYVEIATDNLRLIRIFKAHNKVVDTEYTEYLNACVRKMKKYYGFSENYTKNLLEHKDRVPSFVKNLRDEIDIRLPSEEIEDIVFKANVNSFYSADTSFAKTITRPLVSYKQDHKYKGALTDDNPIRIKEVGGSLVKVTTKSIRDLDSGSINKINSNDTELKSALDDILNKQIDEDGKKYKNIDAYLKKKNLDTFVLPSGRLVRRVSMVGTKVENVFKKVISENNYTAINANKYYCIEVYKTKKGKVNIRGIRYVDLVKKDKKLHLRISYPDDYQQHVTYLFANDYVRIFDVVSGMQKFEGYYKSIKTIGRKQLYFTKNNRQQTDIITINQTDDVKKFVVDILGKIGGEVKCSVPLPLLVGKQ